MNIVGKKLMAHVTDRTFFGNKYLFNIVFSKIKKNKQIRKKEDILGEE